jgi:hypothetical protein
VLGVDAESEFGPMADSIEDVANISAAGVRPGYEVKRHAPVSDDYPSYGGRHTPIEHRQAVMVHSDDQGHHNEFLRTAARSSGPMDPSGYLTGVDHGLDPEQRAEVIARQQDARSASAERLGDGGRTMSPARVENIYPRRR